MWKDSLIVGIEFIDLQHKELCDTTEKLLLITQDADPGKRKQECANAVAFLKDYAIRHFVAEEEYQRSISYRDILAHQALHRSFISAVNSLDQKLQDTDYGLPAVKEVSGFLTAWLTYHIAGIDQKLKKKERLSEDQAAVVTSYVNCFAQSAQNVFETMIGHPAGDAIYDAYHGNPDDIRIMIGLVGDAKGEAVFTFSREITFSLIRALTSIDLTEIDELAYSALSEISNIISGNASQLISAGGKSSDIQTPKVITDFTGKDNRSGFHFDTGVGLMAISVNVA
ncbi:MAG: bacteriohemerythrin [Clostridiales bacterium]|nr:bacteriohemerythrin [Clostridiales bacterium]